MPKHITLAGSPRPMRLPPAPSKALTACAPASIERAVTINREKLKAFLWKADPQHVSPATRLNSHLQLEYLLRDSLQELTLDFSGFPPTDALCLELARTLQRYGCHLRKVTLLFAWGLWERESPAIKAVLTALRHLTHIDELFIGLTHNSLQWQDSNFLDGLEATLRYLPNLQKLSLTLDKNLLDPEIVLGLFEKSSQIKSLKCFVWNASTTHTLGSASFKKMLGLLGKMNTLESLSLTIPHNNFSEGRPERGIDSKRLTLIKKELSGMSALTYLKLDISHTNFAGDELTDLADGIAGITGLRQLCLNMSNIYHLGADGRTGVIAALSHMTSLESLTLKISDMKEGDSGEILTENREDLTQTHALIQHTTFPGQMSALKQLDFDISHSKFTDDELVYLASWLTNMTSLTHLKLDISHLTELTAQGALSLLAALQKIATLESLTLNISHTPQADVDKCVATLDAMTNLIDIKLIKKDRQLSNAKNLALLGQLVKISLRHRERLGKAGPGPGRHGGATEEGSDKMPFELAKVLRLRA